MNKKVLLFVLIIIIGGLFFLTKKSAPIKQQPITNPTTSSQEAAPSNVTQSQNTVTLTQNGFSPTALTIKAGTKVIWMNKSGGEATVNSGPHPTHANYSSLNLGIFPDGSTFSLVFDKPGKYG